MKIKTEVNVDISAKVVYRDGKVQVTLFAASDYGKRKLQVSHEVKAPKELVDMLENLVKANQDLLLTKLEAGRSEVIAVAARLGEM